MLEQKIKELEHQIRFEEETLEDIKNGDTSFPLQRQLDIIAGLKTALAVMKS